MCWKRTTSTTPLRCAQRQSKYTHKQPRIYLLEISLVAQVDGGGCLSGGGNSALVLKGVSLTVHSGEVMAILGSKGSGKRALLDVIARRTDDTSRGQVQLNGTPLTRSSFQQRCGYVTHSCSFIPGLTVSQTLHYSPTTVRKKT